VKIRSLSKTWEQLPGRAVHFRVKMSPGLFPTLVRGWPVSRILCLPDSHPRGRWPFIWPACHQTGLAAYPDLLGRSGPVPGKPGRRSLFGIAPGGACRAETVAGPAVGSYPTVSPLPTGGGSVRRRSVFCGALPRVSPAGRYPAPSLRGVRTFLDPGYDPEPRPSGHPHTSQSRLSEVSGQRGNGRRDPE